MGLDYIKQVFSDIISKLEKKDGFRYAVECNNVNNVVRIETDDEVIKIVSLNKNIPKISTVKRMLDIKDLYLKGWSQMKIANELNISQKTVSNYIKKIKQDTTDN